MGLVHNEKTKLTATWANGVATAAVAVGGIAPSIAAVTGSMSVMTALLLFLFWLIFGIGAHVTARAVLDRLKDQP